MPAYEKVEMTHNNWLQSNTSVSRHIFFLNVPCMLHIDIFS